MSLARKIAFLGISALIYIGLLFAGSRCGVEVFRWKKEEEVRGEWGSDVAEVFWLLA